MRVALIIDTFKTGGGLEHIYQISKGMPEVNFFVMGKGGNNTEKLEKLSNVVTYNKGYKTNLILKLKPDLIHFHHLKPLFHFYKNPLKKIEIPIIFTAHGLHLHKYEFIPGIKSRIKRILRFQLEKRLFRRVDRVIAVSEEDESFMKENYCLQNTVCITNGIDPNKINKITERKEDLRKILNLPLNSKIFLTVARFNFQKGYDILVNAIALGKKEFGDSHVKFIFVGDGEELEAIKNLTKELSISNLIQFIGERKDIYRIMKASDLFILPSRWEGLPITLIEASFLNLPIVASDTYGNREIVKEGVNGFLFENENSEDLCRVLLSVIKGEKIIETSKETFNREIVQNYHISTITKKLKKLYEELITK